MGTKSNDGQRAEFYYNSENKNMVLGDTFENKIAWYLKNNKLKPSVIKNYLINNGRLLFNKIKSLRYGQVILLDDGSIKNFEIINTGTYTIFGDNGIDIWCNWLGEFILIFFLC
jgi:hypothetical protein